MIKYKLVFIDEASGEERFIIEEREESDGWPMSISGRIGTAEGTGPLLRIELYNEEYDDEIEDVDFDEVNMSGNGEPIA